MIVILCAIFLAGAGCSVGLMSVVKATKLMRFMYILFIILFALTLIVALFYKPPMVLKHDRDVPIKMLMAEDKNIYIINDKISIENTKIEYRDVSGPYLEVYSEKVSPEHPVLKFLFYGYEGEKELKLIMPKKD
jgi:preprotein translocase subunit SecG